MFSLIKKDQSWKVNITLVGVLCLLRAPLNFDGKQLGFEICTDIILMRNISSSKAAVININSMTCLLEMAECGIKPGKKVGERRLSRDATALMESVLRCWCCGVGAVVLWWWGGN